MTELTQSALDALKLATADHQSIRLPMITDRKVYQQVARALERIAGGGRWDRKTGAHVFTQDPRPALAELIGSAVIPHPLASEEKEHSYWPTPTPLAQLLVKGLDLPPNGRVLEPSAGDGQLVRAIQDAYPFVVIDAIEPNDGRRMALRMSGGAGLRVYSGVFEDHAAEPYDAVVMNPPFTLPGRRYAWAEHLVLAWGLLKPGGQLRAIVPVSLEYGRQRPIAAARKLIEQAGGTWTRAPHGAFQGVGTSVQVVIVEAAKGAVSRMDDEWQIDTDETRAAELLIEIEWKAMVDAGETQE